MTITSIYPVYIILSVILAILLIKSFHNFFRTLLFLLMSLAITAAVTPAFHVHFYGWGIGNFSKSSNMYTAKLLLDTYRFTENEKFNKTVNDVFKNGKITFDLTHEILIKKDGIVVYDFNNILNSDNERYTATSTIKEDGYSIDFTVSKESRGSWITFIRYLKALGKGEVIYAVPERKYTDLAIFNIAVYLLLEISFMHYAFRVNSRRLKKLAQIFEE